MQFSLLESGLEKEIIPVIQKLIGISESQILTTYQEMRDAKGNDNWWKRISTSELQPQLSSYKDCIGLGTDFPIWFNWETDKKKTMIIGRDPQRPPGSTELVIASPFGLASAGGRNSKRSKYWDFVKPLL